jgi:hypothetical protein
MTRFSCAVAAVLLVFLAGSCSKASIPSDQSNSDTPGADGGTAPATNTGGNKSDLTPSQQSDWNAIERLEAQAKAIAVIDGCLSSSDCRSAPVGSRACGGPRYYIPWCAKTTDSAALYRKLAEVSAAEQAYNKKYEIMSTCEFRMPPLVASSAGSCVVK